MMGSQYFLAALAITLQILSLAAPNSAFVCEPSTDCGNGNIGDLVPDPNDCHNFYLCVDSDGSSVPSDHSLSCGTDKYFNQNTLSCEDEVTPCMNLCNKVCRTTCENDLDLIPLPSAAGDCHQYGICFGGATLDATCEDKWFNGTGCSDNPSDCCDNCVPYCFEAATQVRDPFDCNSYYICIESNVVPDDSTLFTCSTGSFNAGTGVCDTSTEAETLNPCPSYCPTTSSDAPYNSDEENE